jgi:hypothetical protein
MISNGTKKVSLNGNVVSDKPWFIQIKDKFSAYRNKSLKSNITNLRNVNNQSGEFNYLHREKNLPHGKIMKYSELSVPHVQLNLGQHIRGNPFKCDTFGINDFLQDPICVNEQKTQYSGMEQTFQITGIIPDG